MTKRETRILTREEINHAEIKITGPKEQEAFLEEMVKEASPASTFFDGGESETQTSISDC